MRADAASREQLASHVTAVLSAAGIAPSRLGPARRERLTDCERELYFWILRRFATSGRPSRGEICAAAEQLATDHEHALETLAREDLIHLGSDGEIAVAYPFSGRPTAHRIRFPSGHQAYAMCAIDALGVAPMFEEPIEISSQDPSTGDEIRAQVAPDSRAAWWPGSAVVVAGSLERRQASCHSCCPVLNFFASAENAERWLGEHPDMHGYVISMYEAAAAGRAVFGDVFEAR